MKILLYISCFVTFFNVLVAQNGDSAACYPEVRWKAGAEAGYVRAMHNVAFSALPGMFSCNPGFEGGNGSGLRAGGFYSMILDSYCKHRWLFTLGVDIQRVSSAFTRTENIVIDNDGLAVATDEHRLNTTLLQVGITPSVQWYPVDNVFVRVGMNVARALQSSYTTSEALITPSNVLFENNLRTRNVSEGNISSLSALFASAQVTLGYEFPLSVDGAYSITPLVMYSYGLNNITSTQEQWKTNVVSVGLQWSFASLYYPPPPPPPPLPELKNVPVAPVVAVTKPIELKAPKRALNVGVTSKTIDTKGNEVQADKLEIYEIVQVTTHPLLNYVFFDSTQSMLHQRYVALDSSQTLLFDFKQFNNVGTMETYSQILNIIGKRLRDTPKANITLTGCNADIYSELNAIELSKARAQRIAEYLQNVWGITKERIIVQARDLPEKPSRNTVLDGADEDRRVEFSSNIADIVKPIITYDTIYTTANGVQSIVIHPDVKSEAGVLSWRVTVKQKGTIKKIYQGSGEMPSSFVYLLDEDSKLVPRVSAPLDIEVVVTDNDGTTSMARSQSIQVQITKRTDLQRELYNLILFDFGQSSITGINRATVDFIKTRIQDKNSVMIEGLTDRVGETDINKQLALRRAQSVATILGIPDQNIKGTGASELYSNDLPEGRFYCRTVKILIEQKVK